MAQSQTAPRTADTEGPTSFNLMKWIAENPDKLKPPLGANTMFRAGRLHGYRRGRA